MVKKRPIKLPPITITRELDLKMMEITKESIVIDEDNNDVEVQEAEEPITINLSFPVKGNDDSEAVSTSKNSIIQNAEDVKVNGEGEEGTTALNVQEECNGDLKKERKKKKKSRVRFRPKKNDTPPSEIENNPSTSSAGSDPNSNLEPGDLIQTQSNSTKEKYITTITITQSPSGSFVLHNSKLGTSIDSVSGPIDEESISTTPVDQDHIQEITQFFQSYWDAKIYEVENSNGEMTLLHLGEELEGTVKESAPAQKKKKKKSKSKAKNRK